MNARLLKVVHKDTQSEFLFLNVATLLLLGIVFLFAITLFIMANFQGLVSPFTPQETIITIMSAGMLILGILLATLRLNQSLSGPLLVLRNNLDRLGQGDTSARIQLRKADRLKGLSEAFNGNMAELDRKLGRVKETAEKLTGAAESDERLQPLAQELREALQELTTSYDGTR